MTDFLTQKKLYNHNLNNKFGNWAIFFVNNLSYFIAYYKSKLKVIKTKTNKTVYV